MTLKEKLAKAKEDLAEIKKLVENGEKGAEDLQKAIDEVKDAQAKMAAADEANNIIKALKHEEEKPAAKSQEKANSLGENFISALKKANITENKFSVSAPEYVKAATDPQTSPAGAIGFSTTFDKNVVEAGRVELNVRDLFGAESISTSALEYLVEGAMQGQPDVTAEGAKKPQIHFADPTPKTVSLKKIAAFIKESDEYIKDYPFLKSAIDGRLLYELALAEQNELVSELLGTSGIQTDSTSWTGTSTATDIADLILQAAMDVKQQSGFAADAIMINPATWFTLRVAKNGNDEYYGGGFFGAQNIPNLWGIPVCVTPAVTASQIVVGACKTCASVVQNGGIGVEAVNTDKDDFEYNLMTIRAEERLVLAVRRPVGFKLLSK